MHCGLPRRRAPTGNEEAPAPLDARGRPPILPFNCKYTGCCQVRDAGGQNAGGKHVTWGSRKQFAIRRAAQASVNDHLIDDISIRTPAAEKITFMCYMARPDMVPMLLLMQVAGALSSPIVRSIPRHHKLPFSTFRDEYLSKGMPVVISGEMGHWPAMNWTAQALIEKCGSRVLQRPCDKNDTQVKQINRQLWGETWGSVETVDLEQAGLRTLGDLLRAQETNNPSLYSHDQSIDLLCPALFNDIRSPRYFPIDYMKQLPEGVRYTHGCNSDHGHPGHPSIFIGGGDTESGLHRHDLSPLLALAADGCC